MIVIHVREEKSWDIREAMTGIMNRNLEKGI